jgi:LacI family transcriptional regulator
MNSRKRLTITEVAHEAGVSSQTVSRVINNRPDVSPETRQRVQQVIRSLGYQPSALARGLASKRTRTLGLITADFSDYFFTQVIAGAEVEARKHGYFFMLGDEPEYIRLLTEHHVQGILFARPSTEPDNRHLLGLLRDGVPVVTTTYHLPGADLTVVDVDNVDGAQQATHYLLECGRRQIAMITGPATWKSVNDRTRGYRLALEAAGATFEPTLIIEGDWSYQSGYRAMQQLIAGGSPFSAVFAQNDQMAIAAAAAYCDPPLTTIRQPMQEVGKVATRFLIQAVEQPGMEQGEVLLKAELIRRRSCD